MAKRATPKQVKKLHKVVKSKGKRKLGPRKSDNNHKTNPFFQSGTEEATNRSKGNNFWTKRSKHGRDKIFNDPIVLLESFEEYCQAKIDNPWFKKEKLGKQMVDVPTIMPFTMDGFTIFIGVSTDYFYNFIKGLKEEDPSREGFLRALSIIRQSIKDQKYNGAAAGYFKENLISYDLGIRKDEPQMEVTGSGVNIIVANDEDKELLESVRKKLKE